MDISAPSQSEKFLHLWVDACVQRHEILFRDWPNCSAFTSHVFTGSDSIIETIAQCCRLRCYNNYYAIDSILYEDTDLVPGSPSGETWVRRIRIAFEHENNFASGLFQEVSHLMITDCDLRVVVSYPNSEQELDSELNYLHSVIAGSDRAIQLADSGAFLFIAGWRNLEAGSIQWDGYVYDRTKWRRLPHAASRCLTTSDSGQAAAL